MTEPQTLQEIKSGDTVTVFPAGYGARTARVKRVTKYLIILDGGDKYSRAFGSIQTGGRFHFGPRAFIAVGEDANKSRETRRQELLRFQAAHELDVPASKLSQKLVIERRAACDKAEAALRALDEWSDTP